jgi:hypothetical protein
MLPRIAALAVTLSLTSLAHADIHHRHGSTCAPKHTSKDLVGVDERGIYNASSSSFANVTCATHDRIEQRRKFIDNGALVGDHTAVSEITQVRVFMRDLSSTIPFSCYLFSTEEDGFSSWGPTKYACSSTVGCGEPSPEYTGNAQMSWSTWLNLSPSHFGIVCNLPPTTAAGSSYIKAIAATDEMYSTYVRSTEYPWKLDQISW